MHTDQLHYPARRLGGLVRRFVAAMAIVVGAAFPHGASAAIDITGNWDLTVTTMFGPFMTQWQIIQNGTTLSVVSPDYSGTIDPNTGALSFGGLICGSFMSGPDSFTGTAAMDSNSFTATGTVWEYTSPSSCTPFGWGISAVRNPCGNGVVDPGEACDDGNLLGKDCCTFTCTVPADGVACDDGNPLTDTSVCVAGVCTVFTPPEFLVNTTTTGRQEAARVACDSAGGFVVVWNHDIDQPTKSVRAQRYDSGGNALGTEFEMATSTTFPFPDVAMTPSGDFIAVWIGEPISGPQVSARRYDSNGVAQGTEFQVNTALVGGPTFPRVDTDTAGNFVVVWNAGDAHANGVFGRRFNSAGTPAGTQFQVNTYTTGDQSGAAISVNGDGSFFVGWVSLQPPDTSSINVFARRYSTAGAPLGTEFQVSSDDLPNFHISGAPMIATSAGQVVFVWGNLASPAFSIKTLARLYDLTGAPISAEIPIDTNTLFGVAVAADSAGRFVIAWSDYESGAGTAISARQFASDGSPSGTEFQVNGFTYNDQNTPAVCAASDGDFVVTWDSDQQDGSDTGVFGRTFDVPPPPFIPDHYKCYQGVDLRNPPFTQLSVDTDDQISSESVDVQKLKYVCVPVDKNGEGIHDPAAYLACYQVKAGDLTPRPSVEVSSQFQTSRFELKKGKLVCVPAALTVIP